MLKALTCTLSLNKEMSKYELFRADSHSTVTLLSALKESPLLGRNGIKRGGGVTYTSLGVEIS